MMDQFVFQQSPAAFHRRVIPAIAFATHGNVHAELVQQSLVSLGATLAAAARMMDKPSFRTSGCNRPEECLHGQVLRHPLIKGIADQFAIEQVLDTRQVKPAFVSGHVRYIGHPDTVRR